MLSCPQKYIYACRMNCCCYVSDVDKNMVVRVGPWIDYYCMCCCCVSDVDNEIEYQNLKISDWGYVVGGGKITNM